MSRVGGGDVLVEIRKLGCAVVAEGAAIRPQDAAFVTRLYVSLQVITPSGLVTTVEAPEGRVSRVPANVSIHIDLTQGPVWTEGTSVRVHDNTLFWEEGGGGGGCGCSRVGDGG